MCGRYSLTTPEEALRRLFDYTGPARNLPPRYNIAPTQGAPVVRANGDGGRELAMLRWGLVPSWADDPAIGNRMINARAETVAEKPSFRQALAARRCLVPATGFYEWQKTNGAKQPWNIRPAGDDTFAFAGLWEVWDKGEAPLETFTIVTTEANDVLRPIHGRMPVILGPENYGAWLDTAGTPAHDAQELLGPCPAAWLAAGKVGTHVNKPANDDAQCLAPPADGHRLI